MKGSLGNHLTMRTKVHYDPCSYKYKLKIEFANELNIHEKRKMHLRGQIVKRKF